MTGWKRSATSSTAGDLAPLKRAIFERRNQCLIESKGFLRQADLKARELEEALLTASRAGRLPILCDTGPCVYRLRQTMDSRLKIYEPVEFILNFLLSHLHITSRYFFIAKR